MKQLLDDVTVSGRRRFCVVQGDCREVVRQIWPGSVKLIMADPPYGLSEEEGEEITRNGSKPIAQDFGPWDRRSLEDLVQLLQESMEAAALPLHENGSAYLFSSDKLFEATRQALANELRCQRLSFGAWCKTNPAPSNRKAGPLSAMELFVCGRRAENPYNFPGHQAAFNYIRAPIPAPSLRRHPCEKPQKVLKRLILASSSPGDVVLDPFCGGGSTGEAALRLGRRFIGIDLDGGSVARAEARLEKLSSALASRARAASAAAVAAA